MKTQNLTKDLGDAGLIGFFTTHGSGHKEASWPGMQPVSRWVIFHYRKWKLTRSGLYSAFPVRVLQSIPARGKGLRSI
jgi:hypothetical protein